MVTLLSMIVSAHHHGSQPIPRQPEDRIRKKKKKNISKTYTLLFSISYMKQKQKKAVINMKIYYHIFVHIHRYIFFYYIAVWILRVCVYVWLSADEAVHHYGYIELLCSRTYNTHTNTHTNPYHVYANAATTCAIALFYGICFIFYENHLIISI